MEGSVQAKETQVGWRHVSWGLGIFTVEVVSEKKKTPNIPVTSLSLCSTLTPPLGSSPHPGSS